ncbi:MAG: DUF4388 domain-containing protein [Thermoanaerobaculia bacterium]
MALTEEFRGDFQQLPVPMVFHRIVEARARGTLTLSNPGESVHLFFVDGELKTAASTRSGMRLGETLLLHGLVEEEQVNEAVRAIESGTGGRIGKLLVEKGYLTGEVVEKEVRGQVEEIFFSTFLWTEGEFSFLPSEGKLDPAVSLDLPTRALIIEGVRRAPFDGDLERALGDPSSYVRATNLVMKIDSLRLNSEEAYLLSLCDGKTRLRDILRLGTSRSETRQILYVLLAGGLIALDPAGAAEAPPFDDSPLVLPIPQDKTSESVPNVRLEQARAGYVEALACLEKKDFYGAILLLQDSVRLAPQNSEYRFRLAGALARNKSWRQRALDQYREALALDPMRQALMKEYIELLLTCKQYSRARMIARRLAERYPDVPGNQEILARCERAVREHPQDGEGSEEETRDPAETPEAGPSRLARLFLPKPK